MNFRQDRKSTTSSASGEAAKQKSKVLNRNSGFTYFRFGLMSLDKPHCLELTKFFRVSRNNGNVLIYSRNVKTYGKYEKVLTLGKHQSYRKFQCSAELRNREPTEIMFPDGERITSLSNPLVKHCVKLRQSRRYRKASDSVLVVGTVSLR